MRFDFTGRIMAAFGFIAGSYAGKKLNEMANIIRRDDLNGNAVYVWDDKVTFDLVILRRDAHDDELDEITYLKFAFDESITSNYDHRNIFATPPMLSLKRAKKLIITPVDNDDIEVVERYTTEPWEITWRGLLIDMENHEFPLEKLENLNSAFEFNGVWNVDSEILQSVGVHAIFIKYISFDFVEGYEDTISYVMTTRAIRPLEYQLINE
jgi:hypothetical protein